MPKRPLGETFGLAEAAAVPAQVVGREFGQDVEVAAIDGLLEAAHGRGWVGGEDAELVEFLGCGIGPVGRT
ncbi:hypothetical protein ABZS66_46060 [Dactylosporangium sp. NPDC005572]|uniref:hypothetical protein n=1 Tax=Dactylosporangium sp. NPDC005572 TaxID=3156889 RepID=UPI0033B352BF